MKVNKIYNTPDTIKKSAMPPYIPSSDNVSFNAKINIPRKMNMDNLYMYNDVLDIMKECKVGGVISNDGVKMESATDKVIKMLNKLKIKFVNIDK